MRVETLQLAEAILLSIESGHFQYPPCGSRRCNERDGERQEVENDFQYPPCGSRRCNDIAEAILLSVKQLSVPSMRVETLQRCRQLWWRAPPATFSTLHAGRDAATGVCGRLFCLAHALSVPSMRVETLQLPCEGRHAEPR